MANYTLTVRTLSPLHIGTGRELRNKFDYIVSNTQTGRLQTDKILEEKYDPRYPDILPGDMIQGDTNNPAYFRYILSGRPRSNKNDSRLRECVKDVYDVPYIPGSSIKGAIRTAFGAAILEKTNYSKDLIDINGTAKYLDNRLEKELFGKDPSEDLFRALQISDALLPENMRDPNKTMVVKNTNPISVKNTNSSVPVECECIQDKLEFTASLKIDEYLIEKKQFPHSEMLTQQLMQVIRAYSEKRLHKLRDWYKDSVGTERVIAFLTQLTKFSESKLNSVNNMALLQMTFGTGWDGMTYSDWIKSDNYFFENVYQRHLKHRQNKGKAPIREAGMAFPTSRKVVTDAEKPIVPLGWVLLTLEPKS